MSAPRQRICAIAVAVLLAVCLVGSALACPLPSDQDIAKYKANGLWEHIQQNLALIHGYMNNAQGLTEDAALALIKADYGLPTTKQHPGESAGDLRVNFDCNSVIDERDVLGLGYSDLRAADPAARGTSTTMPWGTAAQNNQPRCLVLLIKFSDQAPTDIKNQGYNGGADVNHDAAWAQDKWFKQTDPPTLDAMSVSNYYKKDSYGKLELKGDVFNNPAVCDSEGWITSSITYAQLKSSSKQYSDVVQDAIQQIDPYVNFKDYDSNNDGYLDGLITVYAGPDNINASSNLWYFRWFNSPGQATSDGVYVGSGVWVSEQGWLYMFCHEFGHELGLPDLYDVGGSSTGPQTQGDGYWTLMSHWYIPNMGEVPPMHDAWCRMHLRWADAVDVLTQDNPATFTVNRATSATPDNTVYRVWRNGLRGEEYYLLEYRDANDGIDDSLPGNGGLLIWHVDENRTSAVNQNNSYYPMRLCLEAADNDQPTMPNNPWRAGYNGADSEDYFDDFSVPDAKDDSGGLTGITIEPTSGPGAANMTFTVEDVTNSTLPTLSWDAPADGASVSGSVLMDVTSNAASEVRYYVNGSLKKREVPSGGNYSGFQWDTLTALNGTAKLTAIATSNGAGDLVRVIERTVTVNNPQVSGKGLNFSDNFNSYGGDLDSSLLGLWNLYQDNMEAVGIHLRPNPHAGASGSSLALCQTSFPNPRADIDDPNAGVYQGEDADYIMTPRIDLSGYSALTLKYKVAFTGGASGETILQTQITDDDGAHWKDLEGLTDENVFPPGNQYDTGIWGAPASGTFAQRSVNLNSYIGKQVYIRFFYLGGLGFNVGFAIDDFDLSGVHFVLNSVNPLRLRVGDPVTLSGSGFGATQSGGEVRFNNGSGGFVSQSSVISWNDSTIVCQVPSGATSDPTNGVWVFKAALETNKKPLKVVLPPPSLGGLNQL